MASTRDVLDHHRCRILAAGVAMALGSTSPAASQGQSHNLFNGRDLTGWHADVPAADSNVRLRSPFVVRNGVLVSLGEPRGHLVTDSSYRDYRLEIEYRFAAAPGNAGVLLHASTPRALYGMFPRSIEVQMEHGNAGDFWCIREDIHVPDMERRRGPPADWGITEGKARRIRNLTDDSEHPVGEWNTMVIEAVGRAIRVWVNGDLVNDGSDATADHGRIAVQAEGSEVEFRKLSLTPISELTIHGPVGRFDGQTDVGRGSGAAGSASYDPAQQTYLVRGSGQNMWDARDEFHFVWTRLHGNFILSTRARFLGAGVEPHRKIGWTIRPSLEASSAHVTAALHGNGLLALQFRRQTGVLTEEAKSGDSLPDPDAVIQLERRDGVFLMSVARFGDTLVTRRLAGVSLPDTVYVGLFVCAHNDTVVERARFSNVRITIPARPDYTPYQDYLGSHLELLDVATGNATIVHSSRGSFQAPNWTPDGKALIYAQEGRLLRYDLASRSADTINTGFATRNNNDHVLSFDGRRLGISHHAAEDSGASIIYTLPASGGTPTRVTARGPSYLHGWSPDGRWLTYTGLRNGAFDVYKIPAAGGDEIRLTTAPGLDDGPEYSPDGAYIYFNSSRSGRMQLWRMRPDGTAQEPVTNDGFNNWFPHVSPDGKWIAYLAFPADVAPDDHPFYRHVLLRLMPVGGGPARVIAYVYGGQGTINVPSWSPDGTRLAFVSNSGVP